MENRDLLIIVLAIAVAVLVLNMRAVEEDDDDAKIAQLEQNLQQLEAQRTRDEISNRTRDAALKQDVADKSLGMNFAYPVRYPSYSYPFFYGGGHRRRHHH